MQFQITRFDRVTSTMDVARELAERGAAEGAVVLAEEQTAGRGRAGHAWYSPPEQALYLSIVLRPPLIPAETSWITIVAALAVCDTLDALVSAPTCEEPRHPVTSSPPHLVTLKWFNDVLLNGRKVCGTLVESSITGGQLDYAVLGIGMNVNTAFDAAPDDVRSRATSLRTALGRTFDREAILLALLAHIDARYARLLNQHNPHSPVDEYATRLETLSRNVEIDTGGHIVSGIAARVNPDGSLVVITDQGEVAVSAGNLA